MVPSKIKIESFAKRYHMGSIGGKGLKKFVNSHFLLGPEHTGHFFQPHLAAHCGGPEHTKARCGGHMYVMYANALSVAGTSHSLWHT